MYKHRGNSEAFAGAWDDAVETGTDELEDEAFRRAKEDSDTLLIFMLKARRPGVRQGAYDGLRTDKPAKDVRRPRPA
jgi:hypothetical protein